MLRDCCAQRFNHKARLMREYVGTQLMEGGKVPTPPSIPSCVKAFFHSWACIHSLTEIYMLNSFPTWSHLPPLNWPLPQCWLSLLMALWSFSSLVSSLATLFSSPYKQLSKLKQWENYLPPSLSGILWFLFELPIWSRYLIRAGVL